MYTPGKRDIRRVIFAISFENNSDGSITIKTDKGSSRTFLFSSFLFFSPSFFLSRSSPSSRSLFLSCHYRSSFYVAFFLLSFVHQQLFQRFVTVRLFGLTLTFITIFLKKFIFSFKFSFLRIKINTNTHGE